MTNYLEQSTQKFAAATPGQRHNQLYGLINSCRKSGLSADSAEVYATQIYQQYHGKCDDVDVASTIKKVYSVSDDDFVKQNSNFKPAVNHYDTTKCDKSIWYVNNIADWDDGFDDCELNVEADSKPNFMLQRQAKLQNIITDLYGEESGDVVWIGAMDEKSKPENFYAVSNFDGKLKTSKNQEHIFVNPVINEDSRTIDNTKCIRYAILDFDEPFTDGDVEESKRQQRQFWRFVIDNRILPVIMIVDTAGKGYHGWIRIDDNLDNWQQHEQNIKQLVKILGADENMIAKNHLARLPLGLRSQRQGEPFSDKFLFPNNIQKLLYFEPANIPLTAREFEEILAGLIGATKTENQNEDNKLKGLVEGATGRVTFKEFSNVLDSNGWEARYNETMRRIEYKGFPLNEKYAELNVANTLYDCLNVDKRRISRDDVENHLRQHAQERDFNPVIDYFKSLAWDGKDRLPLIFDTLGIDDDFAKTLIRKWLMQCVAMPHNTLENGYGADGVLTLLGRQGIGKTSFFRCLVPNKEWFNEGKVLDVENKDSMLLLTSGWIMELGEVDSTTKKEQSALKALITAESDFIRPPYGRNAILTARQVSMCATVNADDFLRDAENRRWWTVTVANIDLAKMDDLRKQIDQIWAQVYQLWSIDKQGFRLSAVEREQLENGNAEYRKLMPLEQELIDIPNWEDVDNYEWYSVTEYAKRLLIPSNQRGYLGRTLKAVATRKNVKTKKSNGKTLYCLPALADSGII